MNWRGEFYAAYFKFWYYAAVVPFKLIICPLTGFHVIRTNWVQKVLSGFVVIFCFVSILGWFRFLKLGSSRKGITYFYILYIIGNGFSTSCFVISLWRNSTAIEEFINYYQMSVRKFNIWIQPTRERRITWCIILTTIITNQLVTPLRELKSLNWDTIRFTDHMTSWGQSFVFLEFLNLEETYFLVRYVLFTVGLTTILINNLMKAAMESLWIISTISIASYIKSLGRKAESMSALEGLYEYSKLQHLLQLHNEAFGLAACGLVFGYIPYQVNSIPELIQPTLAFGPVAAFMNSFTPMLFLIFSAWVSNRANMIFKQWLIQKKRFLLIPEPQLSIFLYELANNPIGFNAFGLIYFDTAFLGAVSTLILTFAVVIIQFRTTT